MTKKILLFLLILAVIPISIAFKPITHYYLVYTEWQNEEMALGSMMPDIGRITYGDECHKYLHSKPFLDNFSEIGESVAEKNFFYGFYHHTQVDLEEEWYADVEKKKELEKLHPGLGNYIYEEAISYAIETILMEKDPSIINKMVGSLENKELTDHYADVLELHGKGDLWRVSKLKQTMLIYLSAVESKDYELILEEQTDLDMTKQEWNSLINDAITICKKDDFLKYIDSKNKGIDIPGFKKPSVNLAEEKDLSSALKNVVTQDEGAVRNLIVNYDEKLWLYLQENPGKLVPLAFDLITKKPLFTLKLLFTTLSGWFILSMGAIFLLSILYITLTSLRRSGKEKIFGIPLMRLYLAHERMNKLKVMLTIPKTIMYIGIMLFVFSLVYDIIFYNTMVIGPKQLMGVMFGIIIIIGGFFFTGHSEAIILLPRNMQSFAKSISYVILALGLLVAVISVFYDTLVGRSVFFGIKQFIMLLAGILLIFVAYLMKR